MKPPDRVREMAEAYVKHFPAAAHAWKFNAYLEGHAAGLKEGIDSFKHMIGTHKLEAVPYSELSEYGQGAQDALSQLEEALSDYEEWKKK